MSNVLYRATKYMNVEDALLTQEKRERQRGYVTGQSAEDGKNWRRWTDKSYTTRGTPSTYGSTTNKKDGMKSSTPLFLVYRSEF